MSIGEDVTIRQANDRARALFGPDVVLRWGAAVIRFPASIPWDHAFDVVHGLLTERSSEGA